MALHPRISGDELRSRIKRLGMTYTEAAERLGLTLDGLNKQMRGVNAVSRQTVIILDCLEHHQPKSSSTGWQPPAGWIDKTDEAVRAGGVMTIVGAPRPGPTKPK